jgi:hypothetical protein
VVFRTLDEAPDDLDLTSAVVVSEHPEYPGCLLFQTDDFVSFYRRYTTWLSRYQVLSELFSLGKFLALLEADGWQVFFGESAIPIVDRYRRFSQPLEIPGYRLHDFQNFSLREVLERAELGDTPGERLFFWNWAAGAGKSYICGVGANILLSCGFVDLVIAATSAKLKLNLARFIERAGITPFINDHATPAIRAVRYSPERPCYVMNFEKLRVDTAALAELTRGKRVLFILDECHRLISDGAPNQMRRALDELTKNCTATVWPMSATVVGGNPLRYRDVFSLDGHPRQNPLGTKSDFCDRYANGVREIPVKARNGAIFTLVEYEWSLPALHEVRHRVAHRTMAIRKTDEALKDVFKGMDCWPLAVQASEATRQLYELITADARRAADEGETLVPHYRLMRMVSVTPEALHHTTDELGQKLAVEYPQLCTNTDNAKLEMVNELLEDIREAGDKVVVFCHWTHMGLFCITEHISVPHVVHHGELTPTEADAVVRRFKDDPDLTALVSSDAGTHGLNLQCARYVINIDPLYSYDDLYQRNSRIDRADSHLDGLTAYVLITEDSVEERVWRICDERRMLAEAVQGTEESLSYEGRATKSETENMKWLVLGDD